MLRAYKQIIIGTIFIGFVFVAACRSPHELSNDTKYMEDRQQELEMTRKGEYEHAIEALNKTVKKPLKDSINDDYDGVLDVTNLYMLKHRNYQLDLSYENYINNLKIIRQFSISDPEAGNYQFNYGFQKSGTKAKYHLPVYEYALLNMFQVINAIVLDKNDGYVALKNLEDILPYLKKNYKKAPFVDLSFFDLIILEYLNQQNDDSGGASVAYNNAIESINQSIKAVEKDNEELWQKNAAKSIDKLKSAYEKNLKNDLTLYCTAASAARIAGVEGIELSKQEVLNSRLITNKQYNYYYNFIVNKEFKPIVEGIFNCYPKNLERKKKFFEDNKEWLINGTSPSSEYGSCFVFVEYGVVGLRKPIKPKYAAFSVFKPYEPIKNLTIEAQTEDGKIHTTPLICFLDIDAMNQLHFYRQINSMASNLIDVVHKEESNLCSTILLNRATISAGKESLKHVSDKWARAAITAGIKLAESMNTPKQIKNRHKSAIKKLENYNIDTRGWFTLPDKIYCARLNNIPSGAVKLTVKDGDKIIGTKDIALRSATSTFVTFDLPVGEFRYNKEKNSIKLDNTNK